MTETPKDYDSKDDPIKVEGKLPRRTSRKPPELDELEVLFPEVPITTKQGKFIVSPFVFKDFKRVLELVKKYSGIVEQAPEASLFSLIIANAEDGMDDVIEFIGLCCSIQSEQIEALRFDEIVDLFMTAVEVNRDFLLLRLQESGLRSNLVASVATNGATLSAN
jgi:hypothetical protein